MQVQTHPFFDMEYYKLRENIKKLPIIVIRVVNNCLTDLTTMLIIWDVIKDALFISIISAHLSLVRNNHLGSAEFNLFLRCKCSVFVGP
jgi:hypothetical protein